MKNRYYEIVEGVLIVRNNLSPRDTIYGIAKIFLIIYAAVIVMLLIFNLLKIIPIIMVFVYLKSPISILLFNVIPLFSFIIAHRFPPAAEVIFHFDSKTVKWRLQEYSLEIPFEKIHFQANRIPSKTSGSYTGVTVSAIDSKPFFPNDPPLINPGDKYVKVLWVFYCGSKAEAEDTIETIKLFMNGKLDGMPSKFDNI